MTSILFRTNVHRAGEGVRAATIKELEISNRKDLFPYIFFYKGDLEPYAKHSKDDQCLPYFFVLDEKGNVIHSISEIYTEKMKDIEAVLE